MSRHLAWAELTCPCGVVLQIHARDHLHVTGEPDVREAIKRGELHTYPCTACGAQVRLDRLLAYTDFDRWHWFAVFPDSARAQWRGAVDFASQSFAATVEQRAAPLVQSWAPRFRASMRAIFGLDSLREKLLAFDAGVDDRLLEALKLEVLRWFQLPWNERAALWFERLDVERDLIVLAWSERAAASGERAPPTRQLAVPADAYRRLALDGELARQRPELFASIAVDARLVLGSAPC